MVRKKYLSISLINAFHFEKLHIGRLVRALKGHRGNIMYA
nr:MAG TPA: hypothetical protein [Caudoviricetes sp.]